MEMPQALQGLIAFLLGACVGSFINVVAYRLPREISIVRPGSFCPNCRRPIPWWSNVPILGYVALRGRCLMCGGAIPFRYFLTELALAAAALYLILNFAPADAAGRFIFVAALFAVALIDFDWRLIPNAITLPGIPIGFIFAALAIPEVGWKDSLIGIGAGAGGLFLTGEAYRLLRGREGVGLGDVWLMGMTGAFIGWMGVLFTLFFGSLFGIIGGLSMAFSGAAKSPPISDPDAEPEEKNLPILQTAVPFGPFLALAAAIFALFQPQLIHWYLSG